jgi:glycosyltransferase involved in cell wall biosynthesis
MIARHVNPEVGGAAEQLGLGAESPVMRVLHINAGNLYGGVETLLTTLARSRQLSPGMEPNFATCYAGRSSRELLETGAPVETLGPVRFSRPWTIWRARRRLRRLLLQERFDLVICHMSWTTTLFSGVARAAGHRVAMWAHGFQTVENWLDRMARRTKPDFVIANSRFTAAWVQDQFPKTPVHVIYCPVAPPDLPEGAENARAKMRQELGADADTTVILQVGRLEHWKGHLVHLRALSLLDPSQKWVSWIAGGPQSAEQQAYMGELEAAASELGIAGRVKFLGQRNDVPKLMAAADLFCQPNEGPEPFGLVFIEALWAGLPVISSSLGGALEIVDESCGMLVRPGDSQSLAEALGCLIASPALRLRLGRSGPARARLLCDPAARMNELRALVSLPADKLAKEAVH